MLPDNNNIKVTALMYRDGLPVDISDYVLSYKCSKGSTSGLGENGADGVATMLDLVIGNGQEHRFNPDITAVLDYGSLLIVGDGTNSYAAINGIVGSTVKTLSSMHDKN